MSSQPATPALLQKYIAFELSQVGLHILWNIYKFRYMYVLALTAN